eukprot:TRINITY_DN39989_c0_g2_i1.p1 TRINITY_DN39989_c0_g2~~TRINITY_DN39989_c0_g2_i1.p1  ORF type:complete len:574 (-),score=120.84 TRINITY_DN39989_c0_g2_i1:134-1855(-)
MALASVAAIRTVQRHHHQGHDKAGHSDNESEPAVCGGLLERPALMLHSNSEFTEDSTGQPMVRCGTNLLSSLRQQLERTRAIERLRCLPVVQGLLQKYTMKGPFGVLGETIHPRWFKLNPADATLNSWMPGACYGPPRKTWKIRDLELIDTNEHHNRIYLKFQGSKLLRLKAKNKADYMYWMETIRQYVEPADEIAETNALLASTDLFPTTEELGAGAALGYGRLKAQARAEERKNDKPQLYSTKLQYKYGHHFDENSLRAEVSAARAKKEKASRKSGAHKSRPSMSRRSAAAPVPQDDADSVLGADLISVGGTAASEISDTSSYQHSYGVFRETSDALSYTTFREDSDAQSVSTFRENSDMFSFRENSDTMSVPSSARSATGSVVSKQQYALARKITADRIAALESAAERARSASRPAMPTAVERSMTPEKAFEKLYEYHNKSYPAQRELQQTPPPMRPGSIERAMTPERVEMQQPPMSQRGAPRRSGARKQRDSMVVRPKPWEIEEQRSDPEVDPAWSGNAGTGSASTTMFKPPRRSLMRPAAAVANPYRSRKSGARKARPSMGGGGGGRR